MSDFRAFLETLGLVPPPVIVPDGKWRRCRTVDKPRKKNGSYAIDGRGGAALNWATMTEPALWRPHGESVPDFDPDALNQARREQRRKLHTATLAARAYYESLEPLRDGHPYLEAHNLDMSGCYGLRRDVDGRAWDAAMNAYLVAEGRDPLRRHPVPDGGWIVVPAFCGSTLMTVQRIAPDGGKLFYPGASPRGACYVIDRHMPAINVLCEGLATGLAIFASFSLVRVYVAFSTGNLLAVGEKMPAGMACVASDNDTATEARTGSNPGIVAATAAAQALGVGVAVPTDMPDGCSDWSDWRNARVAARIEAWTRGPHETESGIRRAVDAQLAMEIQRAATFRAPQMEGVG
jgi:putative DNA primase/helicase